MGITSAIVLFAVIWFLTFLVVIPFRIQTQGDLGDVVEGTHAGAPQVHNLARKAKLTTAISAAIWLLLFVIIQFEVITVRDIDGDGMTTCAEDCDDSDPSTFLGAPELCDGIDNNCDGAIDEDTATDATPGSASMASRACPSQPAQVMPSTW